MILPVPLIGWKYKERLRLANHQVKQIKAIVKLVSL